LELFSKILLALQQQIPFVSYRKPNSNAIFLMRQNDGSIHYLNDFSEKGFVFAPFDNRNKTIIFPLEASKLEEFSQDTISDTVNFKEKIEFPVSENSAKKHKKLVAKGINYIIKKKTPKIVLSRKEDLDITGFNAVNTYKNLLQTYKTAFVYMWFHPKVGLWLGATPETLIKVNHNVFKTMALAGTQTYQDSLDVVWSDKEQQEQQFVTDYIKKTLNHLKIDCKITEAYTVKAGNIMHLRSDITGRINHEKLNSVIKVLHPTPAVCGLPKEISKQFILENESYNREFYTGFLGELHFDSTNRRNNKRNIENQAYQTKKSQTNLFVNLRCMKVNQNLISIYVGGGITKDSHPEKEYLETVAKAEVMKRAISVD
jgi:isochorismate synthase